MDKESREKVLSLWERINKREQEILDYRDNPNENTKSRIQNDLNSTKKFFNQNSGKLSNEAQEKFRRLFKVLSDGLLLESIFSSFPTLKNEFLKEIEKTAPIMSNGANFNALQSTRERFARFKNQILGGTVLRDGNIWAEILGDVDFEFWRNIHETEPYLRSVSDIKLDNVTKGKIILERLEKEPSPKRFAVLLNAIYEALVLFFATPKNYGDSMWLTYAHRLQAERESTDFTELQVIWINKPEVAYTQEQPIEKYYVPGEISIVYTGQDWGVEESRAILVKGFVSKVLHDLQKKKSGDQIHTIKFGGDFVAGDKIGKNKNITKSESDIPLWFKWVVGIVAILTFAWGLYIYIYPNWHTSVIISNSTLDINKNILSTTTPNLASIFLRTNSMLDLDKENFLKDYENGPIYAAGATFENINSSGEGFIVRMTLERNAVGCAFGSEFKKELLLLKKGDVINFYGTFTGSGLGGYGAVNPWYIMDCILLR